MKQKVTLTKNERLDILTDAIETRAIQYWACDYGKIKIWRDSDLTITKAEFDADNERGEKTHYVVTHATIQDGINLILNSDFDIRDDIRDSIVTNDNDSESCDVIIQAALFGEIVYG